MNLSCLALVIKHCSQIDPSHEYFSKMTSRQTQLIVKVCTFGKNGTRSGLCFAPVFSARFNVHAQDHVKYLRSQCNFWDGGNWDGVKACHLPV